MDFVVICTFKVWWAAETEQGEDTALLLRAKRNHYLSFHCDVKVEAKSRLA